MALVSASDYAKMPSSIAAEKAANAYSAGLKSPSMPKASTPSSSSSYSSGGSNYSSYTPQAITQSYTAAPALSAQPNMPQQVNGSMYSQVPGTNWYSTNPSNPNAPKYTADGKPVATVGYDNQQTGQSYHGYATPEQFQQITSGNNSAGTSNLLSGMLASGQLNMPQSSIYSPSGGYANMPMSASQSSSSSGMPGAQTAVAYSPGSAEKTVQLIPQAAAGQTQFGQQVGQTGVAMPQSMGNNPYGALTPAQIQSQAAAQIASETADKTRIADQTKAGYQTSYDRMNQQTTDTRNLENFKNSQLLNPFNGYSDYAQGQIARDRATTDRQNQQDLQTKLGGVDSQLADYLNSTPAEQQKIINDMTDKERSYFLQSNAQALQSQNQNFNQNLQTNQFNQQTQNQQFNQNLQTQNQQFSQQQAVKQQHIDLADTLSKAYGVAVYPTDDPMLSYAQVAGIPTVDAQKLAADAKNTTFDNTIKLALANNTISKTQADMLQNAQQLAISKQNANTSASSAAASAGNASARLSWDKDPNNPDNLYKQSEITKNNAPKAKDYKTDPNFAADIAHMKTNPKDVNKLDSNAQSFIDAYGYDGYAELRKASGIDK